MGLVRYGMYLIFRMPGLVVPFHCGRKAEDTVFVIWADIALGGLFGQTDTFIIRTVLASEHTGCSADIQENAALQRLLEPVRRRRKQVQEVEKHGAGGLCPGHPGHTVPVRVSAPDTHGIVRCDAHRPGVPVSVAGTGLPGYLADGLNEFPVNFVRPVHFLEGFKSVPDGNFVLERRVCLKPLVLPYHIGVSLRDVHQGAF